MTRTDQEVTHTSHGLRMALQKERFRKWLHLCHRESIVGLIGKPWQCPLANYLLSFGLWGKVEVQPWGGGHVVVWLGKTKNINSSKYTALPQWAVDFGKGVDTLGTLEGREDGDPITAQECLNILRIS